VRPQLTTAKRAELDAFAHVGGFATELLAATSGTSLTNPGLKPGAGPIPVLLILGRKLNMFKTAPSNLNRIEAR